MSSSLRSVPHLPITTTVSTFLTLLTLLTLTMTDRIPPYMLLPPTPREIALQISRESEELEQRCDRMFAANTRTTDPTPATDPTESKICCRWTDCTHTFDGVNEMVEHVMDHFSFAPKLADGKRPCSWGDCIRSFVGGGLRSHIKYHCDVEARAVRVVRPAYLWDTRGIV